MIGAVVCIMASSLLGDLGAEAPAETPVVEKAAACPEARAPASETAPVSEPAPEVPEPAPEVTMEGKGGKPAAPRSVRITSDRTDFDRREGVIMFDRNVFVDDAEYQMHADQLYVFLDTNRLDRVGRTEEHQSSDVLRRIVALGNVSITNAARVGSCAKAVYTKATSKIVMYGDSAKGLFATLTDNGRRRSQVEGRRITFWIDTEQVEVEGSTVTLDAGGFSGPDGAKKFFGK
ncbi:MAG: LptA/OstA family protein [Kiritimatiellia bacterium]